MVASESEVGAGNLDVIQSDEAIYFGKYLFYKLSFASARGHLVCQYYRQTIIIDSACMGKIIKRVQPAVASPIGTKYGKRI